MIVIIVPVEQNKRMIFIALTGQGVNVGNGHHHVYKEKKYKSRCRVPETEYKTGDYSHRCGLEMM